MIKVEYVDTWGFEHAIRGMRNPLNSWERSDSSFGYEAYSGEFVPDVKIGENDLDLMHRLYVGGQPHRKYLRQIFAVMDITAPLYWWKEFDTHKVGTTANSCSTMHKITAKEFTLDDFSHEHLLDPHGLLADIVTDLNSWREDYLQSKNKDYWWQLIQLLPSSYNQRRTVSMTYENVMNMLDYRENHKLDEWREFCEILRGLPYIKEIRGDNK
jgi:hypothetical protein